MTLNVFAFLVQTYLYPMSQINQIHRNTKIPVFYMNALPMI